MATIETAKHHRISIPEELRLANVMIRFGVGDLDITTFDEAGVLLQGSYENEKPVRLRVLEDEGQIVIGEWSSANWFPYFWYFFGDCHIKLNRNIPSRVAVHGRLGDTTLNLLDSKLQDVRVHYLLGDLNIQFPRAGSMSGSIESTLGNITLVIPREVGARIRLGSITVGKCDIEEGLLERRGSEYVSKNFETADRRLDIIIDYHLGDLKIRSV